MYAPALSPIDTDATLRAYLEREFHTIKREFAELPRPMLSVLKFGADPTGSVDSTAAFLAAAREVNGTSAAGAVAGGAVFVPRGEYLVSIVPMRGVQFIGESIIGTVIKGTGSGAASEFMFDATLDMDASTSNTDGQRGCVQNMTIDANGSGRSLVRTYGDLVEPCRLILQNAIASGAIGLSLGLPIMATPHNIRAINCDIGFHTYSGAGDLATSTTFVGCWADTCLTDGFRITQLAYSSLVNCAAQDCGTNNFYFDGSSNGVAAIFSITLDECGSEGAGVPFRFEDCREFLVNGARVISPDSGQDLMLLDDFTGSIVNFSTSGALAGGAFHLAVSNHNGGDGAIVVIGGNVTYADDATHRAAITPLSAVANGSRLSKVGAFSVSGLPTQHAPGMIIFVTDEAGGAVLAFSDGTNWRRVTDRNVVS